MAQRPSRARSAPIPLCATGQRSRLTAPLGQRRTLTTVPAAGMHLTLKTRTADMPSQSFIGTVREWGIGALIASYLDR